MLRHHQHGQRDVRERAGSLFSVYTPATARSYTFAVSDGYQDLFGEGSHGEGGLDIDAFNASLEGRFRESLLSRFVRGPTSATALRSDLELVDDYPASVLAHARATSMGQWGWQILRAVPSFPNAACRAKHLPISRFKLFDTAPSSCRGLCAGLAAEWTFFQGSPWK